MNTQKKFSMILQDYFFQRLIQQRNASNKTIKSYRDTFRLLFTFAKQELNKNASQLTLKDINASFIVKFLEHLEKVRKNKTRSRNARLAAIRSFLQYASYQDPSELSTIQQVLAIPMKRFDRPLIGFLSRIEIDAILSAPDLQKWNGHRDQVMLATFYNTGARVSEIIELRQCDVDLIKNKVIYLHGKGRKERVIPLWENTAKLIRKWLTQIENSPGSPLFPNRLGNRLTRSGVESRLKAAVAIAVKNCNSLKNKKITPHIVRHTTAMHLLQSGVDITVISLWLGHESITTTHHYIEADLKMKKRALNTIKEPANKTARYAPSDKLLTFLENL